MIKLTSVYPIPEEALKLAAMYPKICFAEESAGSGGLSEKFAAALMTMGWHGSWRSRAIHDFVQQGSVSECLERIGLNEDALYACAKELADEQPS